MLAATAIRLVKLGWRVDLAPDVPVASVNSPTLWRVVVFRGQLPQDITQLQLQAFPSGAASGIPAVTEQNAAVSIIHDEWLNFANGDPGLNSLAFREFADAGPAVPANETMTILITPIIDANLGQGLVGAANAQITIEAFGTGDVGSSSGAGNSGGLASLPRFDVAKRNDA
jgi:hypothetical protein